MVIAGSPICYTLMAINCIAWTLQQLIAAKRSGPLVWGVSFCPDPTHYLLSHQERRGHAVWGHRQYIPRLTFQGTTKSLQILRCKCSSPKPCRHCLWRHAYDRRQILESVDSTLL